MPLETNKYIVTTVILQLTQTLASNTQASLQIQIMNWSIHPRYTTWRHGDEKEQCLWGWLSIPAITLSSLTLFQWPQYFCSEAVQHRNKKRRLTLVIGPGCHCPVSFSTQATIFPSQPGITVSSLEIWNRKCKNDMGMVLLLLNYVITKAITEGNPPLEYANTNYVHVCTTLCPANWLCSVKILMSNIQVTKTKIFSCIGQAYQNIKTFLQNVIAHKIITLQV